MNCAGIPSSRMTKMEEIAAFVSIHRPGRYIRVHGGVDAHIIQ